MNERYYAIFCASLLLILAGFGYCIVHMSYSMLNVTSKQFSEAVNEIPKIVTDVNEIKGRIDGFAEKFDALSYRLERLEDK